MTFRQFFSHLFFISICISISVFGKIQPKSSQEGLGSSTILYVCTGSKKIADVMIGDLVLSKDLESGLQVFSIVTNIAKQQISSYLEIVLQNEIIITAPGQQFYIEFLGKWITADELSQSLALQKIFPVQIIEIRCINEPIEVYKLTVAHQHNFYVSKEQLIAHNFVQVFVAPAAPAAVGIAATIVIPAVKSAGFAIGAWIISKLLESFRHNPPLDELTPQDQGKNNKDQCKKDKHHNKKKENEPKQSAGPGGPGGPNWPPKKNGNNNKKPDENNDDKNKDKKNDGEKDNEKKNEKNEKKNESGPKKTQDQVNSKDIARHIAENEKAILESIEPALKELEKNGNSFKFLYKRAFNVVHIFSPNHITAGLLKIGENIKSIPNNVQIISEKIITIVGNADKLFGFKEGLNPILTYINGLPVEIHVFLKNNTIMSFDAFIGHSSRALKSNNLIKM